MIAWNGSAEEFWEALAKCRAGTDIESDAAVIADVLDAALRSNEWQSRAQGAEQDAAFWSREATELRQRLQAMEGEEEA